MHPWTFYALEVSRDRERELSAIAASSTRPHGPSTATEPSGRASADPSPASSPALSRGSAAAVRRLDDCVADELGRSLAPTEVVASLPEGGSHVDEGTAAVSWGPDRIDLFWVGCGRRPDPPGLPRRRLGRPRITRRDARLAAGRDGLGGRPAPGLRHLPRRCALEPLLGRHSPGTPGSRSAASSAGTPAASSWSADRIDVWAPGTTA